MLDQQDRNAEPVADCVDAFQQVLGLGRVHAGGRLIKQQQLHAGCERTRDFELALGAVRQVRRLRLGETFKLENPQQVDGLPMHLLLFTPEARGAENRATHVVAEGFVERDKHVLLNRHLLEQADILESSSDAGANDLIGFLAVHFLAVQPEFAVGGLVHAGEQVEDGRLTGAVRSDQADELTLVDGHVEIVDSAQTTEGDAEMLGAQDWLFSHLTPPFQRVRRSWRLRWFQRFQRLLPRWPPSPHRHDRCGRRCG